MTRCSRLETSVYWLLIALTVMLMAMVSRDAWNRIGQPAPGFAAEINETAPHDEPIVVHLAVNSGRAAVGATKIEGAAGTRWTYTASGPVTNVAARLATLADGGEVMVGAVTAERLPAGLPLEDLGELHLRNVEAPVRSYRLSAEDAVPAARIG